MEAFGKIMDKIPITIWNCWNPQEKIYELNHIENGHVMGELPLPKSPEFLLQKSWSKNKWQKRFGFLYNNKIEYE